MCNEAIAQRIKDAKIYADSMDDRSKPWGYRAKQAKLNVRLYLETQHAIQMEELSQERNDMLHNEIMNRTK